jgi:large subunit ribosomal protein L24
MPIPVANVAIKDPKTGKPVRVGYKVEDKKKVRIVHKTGTKL